MIFGVAYQPIASVVKVCEDAIGVSRVQLVRGDDQLAHRRAYIIVGVSSLRRIVTQLTRYHATVVVIDAVPMLRLIRNICILDAIANDPVGVWNPRTFRIQQLRRALLFPSVDSIHISLRRDDSLTNLIQEMRERGVLGPVLAFAQRLGEASQREVLHLAVARYLNGEITLNTLARRSRPTNAQRMVAYEEMLAKLQSEQGVKLKEALQAVRSGMKPDLAAIQFGVDSFEINYVVSKLRNSHT